MKKRKIAVIVLTVLFLIFSLNGVCEDAQGIIDEKDLTELIPEEYKGYFGEGDVFSYEYLKPLDGEFFFSYITGAVMGNIKEAVSLFSAILVIIMISSLIRGISQVFKGTLATVMAYLPMLCCALTVFPEVLEVVSTLGETLRGVAGLFGALSGVIGALCIASGNVNSSYVGASGSIIKMNIINFVTDSVLMPLLRVMLLFEGVSVISARSEISAFASFTKNAFIQILTGVMTVLITVFTYQTSVASGADSWLLRSTKFAAGSIPVVGGAISEAAKTLFGSFEVIRSVTGGVGVAVILLGMIPPLVKLVLLRWSFMLGSAAASGLGCEGISQIIKGAGEILGFALAMSSIVAFGGIFTLTIFIGMGGGSI